jgi:hypothetical protein
MVGLQHESKVLLEEDVPERVDPRPAWRIPESAEFPHLCASRRFHSAVYVVGQIGVGQLLPAAEDRHAHREIIAERRARHLQLQRAERTADHRPPHHVRGGHRRRDVDEQERQRDALHLRVEEHLRQELAVGAEADGFELVLLPHQRVRSQSVQVAVACVWRALDPAGEHIFLFADHRRRAAVHIVVDDDAFAAVQVQPVDPVQVAVRERLRPVGIGEVAEERPQLLRLLTGPIAAQELVRVREVQARHCSHPSLGVDRDVLRCGPMAGIQAVARALAEDRHLAVADPVDHAGHPAEAGIDGVADEQVARLEIDDVDGGGRRAHVAKAVRDAERHRRRAEREHRIVGDVDAVHLRRQMREDGRGVVRRGGAVEQERVQR